MSFILSFILAVVIALIVWVLSRAVPFLARYADVIGLVVFLIVILYELR